MTARPDFTSQEALDVYIALLRAATSRRQSDEEFSPTPRGSRRFPPHDHSYLAQMLRAHVPWRIATGSP